MLSIGKLAAGGEDYYLEAVAAGLEDYYLGAGEAPGAWGAGAEALGLQGEVAPEDLRAVLEGRAPDGEQLADAPPGRARVPGFDLTFSAPKSVSLLHALGPPAVQSEMVAAHEAAVAAALGYLERHAAFLRRGAGGHELVPAQGLVAAAFRHRLSRAQDPALHTHVLVANLARSADGRAGALDGRALYRHAGTAGHLYQPELRHQLSRRLDIEWRPVRHGLAEIEGVPAEVLRAFSRRRAEILRDTTKSTAGARPVPLERAYAAILRRHRLATGRPPDGALVFARADGRPLTRSGRVRSGFERVRRAAAIEAFGPHLLRHSQGTWLASAGLPAPALAARLRHADPAFTMRRYVKPSPADLAAAPDALAALRERERAHGRETGGRQDAAAEANSL
jgi:conjugative relaxase-like TrwC/TraI family protein